ncbi:Amuc_1100 family pilus-like protein [Roseibacillus persicicus]|uniref:Amuc_1100 family pilus-like protein n=1 Tax=Roseibacillus persicicus TaxID=454148 RepID=UPI00280D4713|nr:Amuc_1100 family pilus-like protein [Roseibacillus persicicus]MDQ8191823.1 Amuc_1100 family pilus-like protein [Roseibacillus persicicus]
MKENGFAIGLLVGTLVIGGGLVALGMGQSKKYAELQGEYTSIKANVEQMARVTPFPTEENRDERKTEVVAFLGKVEGLQKAMQGFRPENLEKISPSELQNRLVTKTEAVKALFDEKEIDYPEKFAFGMESYLDSLANPEATAKLNYQLEATEWLFKKLAEFEKVYDVQNIVREPLPSESGQDWTLIYDELREPVPLAQSMPMELVFYADEAAANEFISSLVSSKEYFFTIDMVRIGNAKTTPPTRADAGLEEYEEDEEEDAGGGFGGFGNFNFDEEPAEGDAAEEEEVESEEASVVDEGIVLGQIAGEEGLFVGLQLRLLLFSEEFKLPEFN